MTSLLAARRKHFAATLGLHAYAKSMRLGAASFSRLICALWQSHPPNEYVAAQSIISLQTRSDALIPGL
jgi:hypothetical protein